MPAGWAAAAGAAISAYSANQQAGAAGDAADAAAAGVKKSNKRLDAMYREGKDLYRPYQDIGMQGTNLLGEGTKTMDSALLKRFGLSDFTTDPGYQFRLSQGLNALQGSAAAKGGLLSGATMKGLNEYGQNFASNEYTNAYNRYNQDQSNRYTKLMGINDIGQNATNSLGGLLSARGTGQAANALTAGQNAASGALLQGQIQAQGMNNFGSALGSLASYGNSTNNAGVTGWGQMFGGGQVGATSGTYPRT